MESPKSTEVAQMHSPAQLRVALVRRAHGVSGEVRVESLGGGVDRFAPGTVLAAEKSGQELTVASVREVAGGQLLMRFVELPQREDAMRLSGDYLCTPVAQARRLGKDEWFVWQLIGLRATSKDGVDLGVVTDVEPSVASDIVVVKGRSGEQRYPMVADFIDHVDLEAEEIVITPWPVEDV